MMRRWLILFLFLTPLLLAAADDPAKGHYESALFFLQSQKYQQALDDLNFIVKSFPQSTLADDALFQLGMYYFQEQKQSEAALTYFQQIKDSYTNSNSAPAAYYHIGEIYLSRRKPADLDEAFANFERVTRVFPSSNWVDRSLVGAGTALKWRGEFDKAYEEFSKLKVRFADSPLAPQAQFEMGICSLYSEHYLEAAVDFQMVIDRFPDSEYAKKARDYNTIIYRLYVAPQGDRSIYSFDSTFGGIISDIDDPTSLVSDSNQNIYYVDKGKRTISVFNAQGKFTSTVPASAPVSVFVDNLDRVYVANVVTVTVPGNQTLTFSLLKPGEQQAEPLQEIRSLAVNEFGNLFIVSNKSSGVLAYDQRGAAIPELSAMSKTEREFYKVTADKRNRIYALDKDRKNITAFGPDGRTLFTIGPKGTGYEFDRVEDFALDPTNHIYLLTRNPRYVMIFTPGGKLLKSVPSDKTSMNFEDAKVITIGPSGSIFVVDKKSKRILKLG